MGSNPGESLSLASSGILVRVVDYVCLVKINNCRCTSTINQQIESSDIVMYHTSLVDCQDCFLKTSTKTGSVQEVEQFKQNHSSSVAHVSFRW